MKTAKLAGFPNYTFNEDGTLTNSTGKAVTANKDGIVKMTAGEDVGDVIKKGKKYDYNLAETIEKLKGANQFKDATPVEAKEDTPKTEEEIKADEIRAERSRLKTAVEDAKNAVIGAKTPEEFGDLQKAYFAAQKQFDEFIAANKSTSTRAPKATRVFTEEEKAIITNYENNVSVFNMLREIYAEMKEELAKERENLPEGYKAAKLTGGTDANKAAHVGYEIAQKIRADYAIGRFEGTPYHIAGEKMKVSAIAEKYGVTSSAVGFYVNYLQHKLQKENTAVIEGVEMNKEYTPRINSFYPEGAPFAEDNVKEDNSRYILPAKRAAWREKQAAKKADAEAAKA